MLIIEDTFTQGPHDLFLTMLVREKSINYRMKIVRNSYDFQSSAVIEMWVLGKGWSEVHRLTQNDPRLVRIDYVNSHGAAERLNKSAAEMRVLADELLGVAKQLFP